MFKCSECKKQYPSFPVLLTHLKFTHNVTAFGRYKCGQAQCHRTYSSVESFKKHLFSDHLDRNFHQNLRSDNPVKRNDKHVYSELIEDITDSDNIQPEVEEPEPITFERFETSLRHEAMVYVAALYSNPGLPRSHVQTVVDATESMLFGFIPLLREKVFAVLKEAESESNDILALQLMFNALENPFKNLKTDYQRLKFFENSGYYIKPQSYVIGQETHEVRGKLKMVDITGQFVPLGQVLKKFFEIPNAFKETVKYMEELRNDSSGRISNFIQGPLWQSKIVGMKDLVFPLFINHDDFEANDPLGASTCKIGAVYCSVPSIPPECQSSTENIFLALLFEASARKQFGNRKTLAPLIDELISLNENGVKINTEDGEVTVRFVLGLVTGDNLGLNSLCGFVESFSAHFSCRVCKVKRSDAGTLTFEDTTKLRDVESYDADVETNDVSLTGVSEKCVFNFVPGFHIVQNLYVGPMHDNFEGTFHYGMIVILRYFILDAKFFSVETLNSRIDSFDYGPVDFSNKPPKITREMLNKNKLRMTASQTACFVRYFGILIGDLVPEDDSFWSLYCIERQLLQLITSKIAWPETAAELNVLAHEHNALYLSLSGDTLKPKHHHLLHYGRVSKNSGPLAHLSCMRFESKHQNFKKSAHATTSRRNAPLTLAIKHQFSFCNRVISAKTILKGLFRSAGTLVNLELFEEYQYFKKSIPRSLNAECVMYDWVDYKGTRYSVGMALIVSCDDFGCPVFGEIVGVFVPDEKVTPVFLCRPLCVVSLDDHFGGYKMKKDSGHWYFYDVKNLLDPFPLNISLTSKNDLFIVLKHNL